MTYSKHKLNLKKNTKGFTILELIIATSVFSVMLLLTTTGMIQIGRVYYKGLITSKTQETARSVSDEIVRAVQFGGTATLRQNPGVNISGLQTYAVCMNNVRYTYAINTRLAPQNAPPTAARHVLWLDILKAGSGCLPVDLTKDDPGKHTSVGGQDGSAGALDTDLSPEASTQRRELLTTNMRLNQFSVAGATDTVSVNIKVIYGQDDVVTPAGNCVSTRTGGQFCAFSSLNAFAKRRL